MTDTEMIDWLEKTQAHIDHANHRFYINIYTHPDPKNKKSLRDAIRRRAARGTQPNKDWEE